ncbi:hypothetical protein NQ317_008683 [Molorchus minor]|uniref:DUF4371 domain-containing protein n=1 Tax=Molorchus minor TaxID=1323400 RepID=A0ABQ9K324_9CUCU|nr:hypothetical protein NQ317_008683 [Molorchus minor]
MCIESLNDLLEKPFACFSREEQLDIAKRGRYTDMTDLAQKDKGKCRMFSPSWYQRVKWLAGNSVNRKLYCWNCVLFPSGTSRLWNTTGFDDLRNLSQATKKHEESKEHIYSTVKLRILCKSEKQEDRAQIEFETNVLVRRNREYLERLIDLTISLSLLELPFRHDDSEEGPYKIYLILLCTPANLTHQRLRGWVFLTLLKKYDDIVRTKVEQDSSFKGFTKTIQIDLINSIAHVIRQRIIEEVSASNFFSLMVDEATCTPQCKQISVSIRFVKNGTALERFLGLYDVEYSTKADEVASILERELEKFNFKEKLVSQSYDGDVVKPTELYSLQQAIKHLQSPDCQATLVHSYAHDFNALLAQSLKSIQDCKLFFSIITLFGGFFRKVMNMLPNVDTSWLESIPRCVKHVRNNYESILKVLEFITTSENFENDQKTMADAVNLIHHMKDFKFMSLLTMFEDHFSLIDQVFDGIKRKFPETKHYRHEINSLIERLKTRQTDVKFNSLIKEVPITGAPNVLIDMFSLHIQILDNIIHDIEGRCLDIEMIDFFGLLDCVQDKTCPDTALISSVKENYHKFFETTKLKTELDLLYADPSIGGLGEGEAKSVGDVLDFFYAHDIRRLLPELYKLLELVATMPTFAEPLKGKRCALNMVRSEDLLAELQKSNQWYTQVIDYFATLPSTSSIELTYKNSEPTEHLTKMEVITEPELNIKAEIDVSFC